MSRIKEEEPRVAAIDDLEAQAKQYIFFKKQVEYFESELKLLKEKIFEVVDTKGEVDGNGNIFVELPNEIDGVTMLQKQRRVSRKIDPQMADNLIVSKGLETELYKTIQIIDEDALMAALYEGKLTEEEVDLMYPQKIVWALILNKR
jgi:hypothetical protein